MAEARPSCGEKSRIRAGVATRQTPSTKPMAMNTAANAVPLCARGMPTRVSRDVISSPPMTMLARPYRSARPAKKEARPPRGRELTTTMLTTSGTTCRRCAGWRQFAYCQCAHKPGQMAATLTCSNAHPGCCRARLSELVAAARNGRGGLDRTSESRLAAVVSQPPSPKTDPHSSLRSDL